MDLFFEALLLIICISNITARNNPQVHENPEDKFLYVPLNFRENQQQNMLALRYLQQQKVDATHFFRDQNVNKKGRIRRSFTKHNKRGVDIIPIGLEGHVRQPDELMALTALIGKNPNVQLQGLNSLLGYSQPFYLPLQSYQKPQQIPIEEHTTDVRNPQERPNINIPQVPLATPRPFYPQLNSMAHIQAQRIISEAQQAAEQEITSKHLAQLESSRKSNMIFVTPMPDHDNLVETQSIPLIEFHSQPLVELKQPAVLELKDLKQEEPPKEDYEDKGVSKYAFGYRVRDYHTGNDFGHEEVNEGDYVKGHYHVLLPDGRLQNVHYWADKSGFHSKVTYENIAKH